MTQLAKQTFHPAGSFSLSVTSAGVVQLPGAPVFASLTIDPTGSNNSLKFTARNPGLAGNSIKIRYSSLGNSQPLTVVVAGTVISVYSATNGGGTFTSTATQVKDAIEASAAATALVRVDAVGTISGTIAAVTRTPLSGGADFSGAMNINTIGAIMQFEGESGTDDVRYTFDGLDPSASVGTLIRGGSPFELLNPEVNGNRMLSRMKLIGVSTNVTVKGTYFEGR
jgi:hypothetical protein